MKVLPSLCALGGAVLLASPLAAAEYRPGETYFGERKYVEYLPGDLPIVISAPHGGLEKPDDIPTREEGKVEVDTNTQDLARAVGEEFLARTGHRVHLIISRLHRQKLDCNREVVEAAAGNPVAEKTWTEYHGFIDQALATTIAKYKKAFYIDLHGQRHPDKRIELGYLHTSNQFAYPEAKLNDPAFAAAGSFRRIAEKSNSRTWKS